MYKLEFIELYYHVFLELIPEFLDLLLLVGIVPDVVLLLEDPLELRELRPVLPDRLLYQLHPLLGLRVP